MAGRTWLSGVRQLQRGRQVRAWSDGRTDVSDAARSPSSAQIVVVLEHSVHLLRDSLDATVKRLARRLGQPGALALSGGLDSRLLLASLTPRNSLTIALPFVLTRMSATIALRRPPPRS